ncbi:MAG: hypothetical protein ACREDK_05285 [Thermoplasmata archaeon]
MMNQRIVWTGLAILVLGVSLVVFPLATTGVEQVDLELQVGVFVLPVGLSIALSGAAAPSPDVTTVGGWFGNSDENFLRRHLVRVAPFLPTRLLPHPMESVNCAACYTAIPADTVICPRCARARPCRVCTGPLQAARSSTRCSTCRHAEVYCDCPKVKKAHPLGGTRHVIPT